MPDNLEDYVSGYGMTLKTKIHIIVTVTLLMCVGCVVMGIKAIVVGSVWLFHILYFCFGVKTIPAQGKSS